MRLSVRASSVACDSAQRSTGGVSPGPPQRGAGETTEPQPQTKGSLIGAATCHHLARRPEARTQARPRSVRGPCWFAEPRVREGRAAGHLYCVGKLTGIYMAALQGFVLTGGQGQRRATEGQEGRGVGSGSGESPSLRPPRCGRVLTSKRDGPRHWGGGCCGSARGGALREGPRLGTR